MILKSGKWILYFLLLLPGYAWSQITASDSSGCAPLVNVAFTSPAGATGINWDFDDATSSNLQSPVHTFTLAGIYNVVYTATLGGNPVTYTLTINVYGKPDVIFGGIAPTSGCIPLNVSFKDSSIGGGGSAIVYREWAFGDGGVNIGNVTNPSYLYTLPGSFTVSLKVTDANGCDTSLAKVAYVNVSIPPNPVLTTNPSPAASCLPPLTVSFSAASSTSNSTTGGGLTYLWNFGGGDTSIAMNPPVINYTLTGVYPISLTVSDNNNCSATTSTFVVISQPVADFFAANASNDTVCATVNFQNNSTGVNPWFTYGDGTFGADTFHTYPGPGPYQVTLQVQSGTCIDDTTITIVVENVLADFVAVPSYSCSWPNTVQYNNQSTNGSTYSWTFADDSTSTLQNPSHTYLNPDTNQYTIYYEAWVGSTTLEVTSAIGCMASISFSDTVYKPTARFMPDVAWGCAPLTVTFSDSSYSNEPIVNWNWIFGDGGTNVGTSTTVTHTYNQPGVYYALLVITNSAGCKDTSYPIAIHVGEPSNPVFTVAPTSICVGIPVTFTDQTPAADSAQYWHFTADGGYLSHCYTDSVAVWSYDNVTGLQDVTLTTVYNGCEGSTTVPNAINVLGPLGHFHSIGNCATPMTYGFQGDIQDADHWTWDFGDGTVITNSTASNINHTYATTGDYDVVLTSYNNTSGCAPYVETETIHVRTIIAAFASDSLMCANVSQTFSGGLSTDVYANCHEGYLWLWGDQQHPHHSEDATGMHTFTTGGYFPVTLVVKDINGCRDTVTRVIHAYDVQATFTADITYGCLPFDVHFTDSSFADTTITQWQWNFGDGTPTSNLQHPTHTFAQTGVLSWQVTLTVTTALGCTDIYTMIVRPSIPDASFSIQTSNNICVGDSVSFIAFSNIVVSYNWNFGNGDTSTSNNPTTTFNTPGFYNVTLTVTDTIGCTSANTQTGLVNVQAYPIAAFVSSADTLFNKCYPLLVTYTDTSIVNVFGGRAWDLGNGSATIGNQTVGTIYQAPGTYYVSLIEYSTNGCVDTIIKSITIEGPVGDFDIFPDTICKGQSITFSIKDTVDVLSYYWDFGDGTTAPGTSPITHIFNINPISGQTLVSLVMWSPDSACTATKLNTIYIYPVIADYTITNNDTIYCLNEPLVVNNTSTNAGTSTWNFGDGTIYNGVTPPPHTYTTPGSYTITLTVSNFTTGCADTLIRNIDIYGIPFAQATGGDTCQGSPVQLTSSGGVTYVWTPSTDLSDDSIQNPLASPPSSTNYLVSVYDSVGCVDTALVEVIIYEPAIEVHFDTTLVIGEPVQLNVFQGPGYSYQWSPATGLSCSNCPDPIAQPLVNTTYYVTIEDDASCFSITSTYEFIIKPITTIDVPTAFTPNGDGDNDVIFVDGFGIKRLIEFKIYNRWGQLLFETDDINNGWNGFYMGKLQNVETYVYFASVETWLEGKVLTKKGSFNLLR